MIDVRAMLEAMRKRGDFDRLANDPRIQFGPVEAPLLGATLLPERPVRANIFRDSEIRFRSNIALDGARYAPVQFKDTGAYQASMLVELADSNIGSLFTADVYDALVQLLNNNASVEAEASLVRWFDNAVSLPMRWKTEKQRWEAFVDGKVVRQGQGIYQEINYLNPSGHRVSLSAEKWSTGEGSADPMVTLLAKKEFLAAKGYRVNRIVSCAAVRALLRANTFMQQRASGIVVLPSGSTTFLNTVTDEQIDNIFRANGLPPIEPYETRYQTTTGSYRFLADDVLCMFCTTGRTEAIDMGPDENQKILTDTFGYVGVGLPVGEPAPGRKTLVTFDPGLPPSIAAQGAQTTLPVLTEPESFVILRDIN